MKHNNWLVGIVAMAVSMLSVSAQHRTTAETANAGEAQPAGAANVSAAAAEVIRLAGSGVGEDVVLAYIQNSRATFSLSVDDVLYLKDVGLSSAVISAMLNHDAALRNQAPAATPATETPATTPAPETTESEMSLVNNAPADVTYFYDDLLPYGSWVDLGGVGWCWQPRAAAGNRSWRPYCDSGHWVYTDAGWYWQSDYSWGWAPFHYGRWLLQDRVGWVWVPDRVWAPAWVVWRSAGDHCGWAPLPPHTVLDARAGWRFNGVSVGVNFDFGLSPEHFTFVAMHDFAARDLRQHRLPPGEVRGFYPQTTVINSYSMHNRSVINHGLPLQRVTAATSAPIPRATIHDSPAAARGGPVPQARGQGQAVVYRPELKAPSKPPSVVVQKVDDRHPVIQHPTVAPGPVQRVTPTAATGPSRQQYQSPKGSQGPGGQPSSSFPQNASGYRGSQPGQSGSSFGSPSGPSGQQGKQQPGASSGQSGGLTGSQSGTPGRSSGPSSGSQSRASDQGKQPSPSGPSSQSGAKGPSSGSPSRPSDAGNQPSRSGPSYQPGSSPGGPPKQP
jgi:hypothetical protein